MSSFSVITFGCQMNVYDSNVIIERLRQSGYTYQSEAENSDIVIVNGCVVRQKPEQKAIDTIKRYGKMGKYVIAAGCLAQKNRDKLKDIASLVVGPFEYDRLPDLIGETGVFTEYRTRRDFFKWAEQRSASGLSAFVTIMTGCDNFCSYCIVPYVRGRETSRNPAGIMKEAKFLISGGVKELTFIGQNVNSYYYGDMDFSDLIKLLSDNLNLRRIRFTTSHPRDVDVKLLKTMAESTNITNWLHIPVQAGSTSVLRDMGRGYTAEEYIELVKRARHIVPHITISTDIMVGYPTETEEDFKQTLDLVRRVQFDYAYMFIYTKRVPSKAASLYKTEIPYGEKVKRHRMLVDAVNTEVEQKRRQMLNNVYEVLVDGVSRKEGDFSRGKTEGNITVVINEKIPKGEFVRVRIFDIKGLTPIAKRVK